MFEANFLESDQAVGEATLAFEHSGIRAFSQLIQLGVRLDLAKTNLRLKNYTRFKALHEYTFEF
jgi:hypothetical protein